MKGKEMSFSGIKSAKKRASLLAYLRTFTDAWITATKRDERQNGIIAHFAVCNTLKCSGKLVFDPNLSNTHGKPAAGERDDV
jgi:hypothetical protein